MFSLFRNRLGIPGIIAVIALVFAMAGGALAAKKYVITSTNQIKPSVLKSLQGKTGPAGPAGANGAAGPAGPTGAPGKDGTNGGNGATGATGAKGATGATGSGGATGATGATGAPWPAGGTLPSNATETGAWGIAFNEQGATDISFSVPLAAELADTNVLSITGSSTPTEKEKCDNGTGTAASPKNPEADPGFLCVFTAGFENGGSVALISKVEPFGESGASKTGALLVVGSAAGDIGGGSWAVTAP